jgi:hypothetical protein
VINDRAAHENVVGAARRFRLLRARLAVFAAIVHLLLGLPGGRLVRQDISGRDCLTGRRSASATRLTSSSTCRSIRPDTVSRVRFCCFVVMPPFVDNADNVCNGLRRLRRV